MKKLVGLLILMLFVFPLASAATTQLTIHTLPIHEVSVYILDSGSKYESLQSFPPKRAGFDGLASFNVTIEPSTFGLFVIIKKEGENVFSGRVDNQETGAFVDVYVLLEEGEEISVDTPELEEETTEDNITEEIVTTEETDANPADGLTGSVVADDDGGVSNIVYIIVGVLLLAGIATFIIVRKNYMNHPALKTDNKPATVLVDSELEDAEKRIKEAEREIKDIRFKNEKKASAQKKFLDAKKELEEVESPFNPESKEPKEEPKEERKEE